MATLVLTAVGTAIGGPIGGLLGAVAGRAIDTQVFGIGNRRVEGPRKDDLTVQSAAFGRPIPLVYGTGRYAGNVLWSTGLIEQREEESQGGKGGPSVTNVRYSYSASFAVGLCAGPIASIGRVWSDGKLLRDVSGDLSVGGSMRAYLGDDDQMPDPLIEGEVGLGQTPGFRGIAYCVFESLELAEFGNRIPNLTFEVVTSAETDVGLVAADFLARAGLASTRSGTFTAMTGYSVSGGQTLRDGLNELLEVFDISVLARDAQAVISTGSDPSVQTLKTDVLGIEGADSARQHFTLDFDHAADLPAEISLGYADPANDYQAGLQRAQTADIDPGAKRERVDSALVLDTAQARTLATQLLSRVRQQRALLQFEIGLGGALLEPGDVVTLDADLPGQAQFKINQITQNDLARTVTASALPYTQMVSAASLPATPGLVAYPQTSGPPTISADVFELPATRQFGDEPSVFASVARLGGRVSTAGLYISDDGGADYRLRSTVPVSGVSGTCLTGLADTNPALFDHGSVLEVTLDHADMTLSSRPQLAVLNGANLARVGSELLQFQTATLTDQGTYLLSGLLRGRGGTENALMGLATGQRFILLQGGDVATRSFTAGDIGVTAFFKVVASGQSLAHAPERTLQLTGRALRPFSPAHLTASYDLASGLSVAWMRRSRTGFAWLDGSDAPLGEASEAYRVTYSAGGQSLSRDVVSPQDLVSVGDLSAAFGPAPYTLTVSVAQLSDILGPGDAATLTLPITA